MKKARWQTSDNHPFITSIPGQSVPSSQRSSFVHLVSPSIIILRHLSLLPSLLILLLAAHCFYFTVFCSFFLSPFSSSVSQLARLFPQNSPSPSCPLIFFFISHSSYTFFSPVSLSSPHHFLSLTSLTFLPSPLITLLSGSSSLNSLPLILFLFILPQSPRRPFPCLRPPHHVVHTRCITPFSSSSLPS